MVDFYRQSAERERLHIGSGLLEAARTRELLLRELPPPPARILDIGGGPGEYAGWLQQLGYSVYLLDLVPEHVEQARALRLSGAEVGDARSVPRPDTSADAALLLGPMYHLTEREDRLLALSEAYRTLRPGGVIAASGISRFASLLHSLLDGFVDDEAFWPILQRDLREGQHRNETGNPKYFTAAVFHRPEELIAELHQSGFEDVRVRGIEGPGWLAKDFEERWQNQDRRMRLLELVRSVESETALIGCSLHLLATGRKAK